MGVAGATAGAPLLYTAAQNSAKRTVLEDRIASMRWKWSLRQKTLAGELLHQEEQLKDLKATRPQLEATQANAELRQKMYENFHNQVEASAKAMGSPRP